MGILGVDVPDDGTPFEKPECLRGEETAAEALEIVGDGGRLLTNALLVGVIGVLEGRSIGIEKFRKETSGEMGWSPFRS